MSLDRELADLEPGSGPAGGEDAPPDGDGIAPGDGGGVAPGEPPAPAEAGQPRGPAPRYRRYLGALGLLILISLALNTILSRPSGATGVPPGARLPPFAVPLVLSDLNGDADVATRADDGEAGRVPACRERGARILNVCELYERGPVVLALFIDAGSCRRVLSEMQALVPAFPRVRFAAVSIKGARARLRGLVRAEGLTFPVGIDTDGALAELYKVATCPQVNFAYPGGVVAQRALLSTPSLAALRARVSELVAATGTPAASGAGP